MPGLLDKSCIGIVRDFVVVDPEGCGVDEALWLFVGKAIAADRTPHQEFSDRNQRHVVGRKGADGQWRIADGQNKKQEYGIDQPRHNLGLLQSTGFGDRIAISLPERQAFLEAAQDGLLLGVCRGVIHHHGIGIMTVAGFNQLVRAN